MSTKEKLLTTRGRYLDAMQRRGEYMPYFREVFNDIRDLYDKVEDLRTLYKRKCETPISEELLCANGFVWGLTTVERSDKALMPCEEGYVYEDESMVVKITSFPKCIVGTIYVSTMNDEAMICVDVKSVADLEDAFDLCGIDKEIVI